MSPTESKKKRSPFDVIIDTMAFLAGLLLLAMTLTVAYSVTLRYLHFKSPIWVLQYTEYALLWITFLGAAWLLKHDGHIRIDSVITRLSAAVRRKLEFFNDIIGALVTLIVFIFGALHTIDLFQRGILEVKGTNVEKYLIYWIVPLGGLMLSIQFIRRAVNKIKTLPGQPKK